MTANKTILVSSYSQYIYKVAQKGICIPSSVEDVPLLTICISGPESYAVTALVGIGQEVSRNGRAAECSLSFPRGLLVDESTHSFYVADCDNNVIRKISFAD